MSKDFGPDVSYVYEDEGYNYDLVVFQKEKPPLDSELNLVQQLQNQINQKQLSSFPSGWLSKYPVSTNSALENSFYTQSPTNPRPEVALVNGHVVYVTNTETATPNLNVVDLGEPPLTGNTVNGVFLEVWRALLDPNTSTNKPDPAQVINALNDIHMHSSDLGWVIGNNGLILVTENGGSTWNTQLSDTKQPLHGIFFINSTIGWVVGDNGFISRTSSGGVRWTTLDSPSTENLNSVYAASQLKAWAVGDSGTILRTSNGITWLPISSGTTTNLNKIFFYDSLVGWVVGDGGLIMKTTDGGGTWLTISSGTTKNLNSVHFYDLNFGFAVGNTGTILRSSDGGASWVSQNGNIYDGGYSSTTEDLKDVFLIPSIDLLVTDEEVTSQFNGTNKDCVVAHIPITTGNGTGTITNLPADVTVKVNGVEVAVDSVSGSTGTVVLANAPSSIATVQISYYFRNPCAVFTGTAWISGNSGTVLRTDDIGANWIPQDSQTAYDLNSVAFTDLNVGWTVGDLSVIRFTENGGGLWSEQLSDVLVREQQRVFFEGNTKTSVFLEDNSIHPDANVETTKRVQIQYKIRVIENVDPDSNPEAGLSQDILGEGPNASGSFGYENMGLINGDYGAWRAKCSGTVDGYCWAIPMYFVNRRNVAAYNTDTNPNGSNIPDTEFIRYDLLTGSIIDPSDIYDVRRDIVITSVSELLERNFDLLSRNEARNRFFREFEGGDRYGVELLQVDRVSGSDTDGGTLIVNATLSDASDGMSSESSWTTQSVSVPATTTLPISQGLPTVSTTYSHDPSDYRVLYNSPGSAFDGRPVPGTWDGIGTSTVTFTFNTNANTINEDPTLSSYDVSSRWLSPTLGMSLTKIPTTPKLVRNKSGAGSQDFWYHGVLDSEVSRVIESWDSGIPGYENYTLAYSAQGSTDSSQQNHSSSVELHWFLTLTSSMIVGTNEIELNTAPILYSIYSISKINNIDSGFSYKIADIAQGSNISITSESGFPFIAGTVVEVVADVLSTADSENIRNGATVNFTQRTKGISNFLRSEVFTATITSPTLTVSFTVSNAEILGVSTTETSLALQSHMAWVDNSIQEVTVNGFGTSTVTLTFSSLLTLNKVVTIQLLYKQTELIYSDDNIFDGLLIGYHAAPYQTDLLSDELTVEVAARAPFICVSNLGLGGGAEGDPYNNPVNHIPVNDSLIVSDEFFSNFEPLKFLNFTVDSGYVQMPIHVPGSFGETITLSSPSVDNSGRAMYTSCNKEIELETEGLVQGNGRKVYYPVIARVKERDNSRFLNGEYLLLIFSRNYTIDINNTVGCKTGTTDCVGVYRLPNKPLCRA